MRSTTLLLLAAHLHLLGALQAARLPNSAHLLHPESTNHSTKPAVHRGCVAFDAAGHPQFHTGGSVECEGAAAVGSFQAGADSVSGWGQLTIATSSEFSDERQSVALGYLEGWLTAEQIYAHHHNTWSYFNMSSEAPLDWLEQQDDWTRQQAAAANASSSSAFWAAMRLLHAQMDGMLAGYNARVAHQEHQTGASTSSSGGDSSSGGASASRGGANSRLVLPRLGRRAFLFMSAVGDVDTVVDALAGQGSSGGSRRSRKWDSLSPHELMNELHSAGRCSAVVRVTPDLKDLLLGHSAWFTFGAMVRIYKHYQLELHHPGLPLRRMSFSSYPGELSSDDDFYLLSTGLAILQTTNSLFNATLYSLLTPQSVLSWQRARIASFLAVDGRQWSEVMAQHNSGTGNNQWMVVDLKLFEPGRELPRGLLWVVEQIPGRVVSSDQTGTLERGYWPSYNIPYHLDIYQDSGYPAFLAQQAQRGPAYQAASVAGAAYQLAPRAQIFRRDSSAVSDIPSLRALLRSNSWPQEPYSGGTPLGALCGRGDLDPSNPRAYGCYDTKATSWVLARQLEADAVVGPTHEGHKPFAWSRSGDLAARVAHVGQPDVFDYKFDRMRADPLVWGHWQATAAAAGA